MKSHFLPAVCIGGLLAVGAATVQAQSPSAPPPQPAAVRGPSLSLAPAVIMLRTQPGRSTTQTLTISNGMDSEMRFELATEDILVVDGKRTYMKAGQIPTGIAAATVAAPSTVLVKPGESASVNVTFTVPPSSAQRAVVVYFRGKIADPTGAGNVGLGASLGTLVTFNLSNEASLESGPITTTEQTAGSNVVMSEELRNNGNEPIVPAGAVVILNQAGRRVAKATFENKRLLPGERLVFAATSPAALQPGRYRAISSFEYEGKILTGAGEFTIPE